MVDYINGRLRISVSIFFPSTSGIYLLNYFSIPDISDSIFEPYSIYSRATPNMNMSHFRSKFIFAARWRNHSYTQIFLHFYYDIHARKEFPLFAPIHIKSKFGWTKLPKYWRISIFMNPCISMILEIGGETLYCWFFGAILHPTGAESPWNIMDLEPFFP